MAVNATFIILEAQQTRFSVPLGSHSFSSSLLLNFTAPGLNPFPWLFSGVCCRSRAGGGGGLHSGSSSLQPRARRTAGPPLSPHLQSHSSV